MRTGKTWHVSFAFYFILLCYIVVASEMKGQEGRLFTSECAQLSSSLVNQVYQDKRGFIWIATRNGFDRYDGFQFQTFHKTPEIGFDAFRNT